MGHGVLREVGQGTGVRHRWYADDVLAVLDPFCIAQAIYCWTMTTGSGSRPVAYQPMTLVDLAGHLATADDDQHRWRLVAELLEEYRHEPAVQRTSLLEAEPPSTGDERWDAFLAALAEHLCARDDRGAPAWAATRRLAVFWFPFDTAAARVDAVVHAPVAFRSRGIFIAPGELGVA